MTGSGILCANQQDQSRQLLARKHAKQQDGHFFGLFGPKTVLNDTMLSHLIQLFNAGLNLSFEFCHGNSRINISDCWVCGILKTLPGCRVSRHYLKEFLAAISWISI